jgi:hypothetical protein
MELRLPKEKLSEIKDRLTIILNSRKLILREIQSVIGLLNFACQVVVPGRAFRRRLIDATCNVKTVWHRVRITKAVYSYYNWKKALKKLYLAKYPFSPNQRANISVPIFR